MGHHATGARNTSMVVLSTPNSPVLSFSMLSQVKRGVVRIVMGVVALVVVVGYRYGCLCGLAFFFSCCYCGCCFLLPLLWLSSFLWLLRQLVVALVVVVVVVVVVRFCLVVSVVAIVVVEKEQADTQNANIAKQLGQHISHHGPSTIAMLMMMRKMMLMMMTPRRLLTLLGPLLKASMDRLI